MYNPASDRGIGRLRGAQRSGVTKWKCWKSWAKVTKAVISRPSECAKLRVFQGGIDFSEKGRVGGGGVENGKKPEKTQFFMVKSDRYGPLSGPNRASSGAFELVLIEFVLKSGPK
jgi:hypothetical protein